MNAGMCVSWIPVDHSFCPQRDAQYHRDHKQVVHIRVYPGDMHMSGFFEQVIEQEGCCAEEDETI